MTKDTKTLNRIGIILKTPTRELYESSLPFVCARPDVTTDIPRQARRGRSLRWWAASY